MTDLDSLSNYLSNHTNFMEIGLMVTEIGRVRVTRPRPFLRKIKIFGVPNSGTTRPIDLKFKNWCCGIQINKYTKFHQNLRGSGIIHWVI